MRFGSRSISDIDSLPKSKDGKPLYRDEEFLLKDIGIVELARLAGVGKTTIAEWRRRLGIIKTPDGYTKLEKGEGDLLIQQESRTQFQLQRQQDNNTQLRRREREIYRAEAETQDYLQEVLKGMKERYVPIKFKKPKIKKSKLKSETVFLSDLHLGKIAKDLVGIRDYNPDVAWERLQDIIQELLQRETQVYNIVCLGDLMENVVVGGMHNHQEAQCGYRTPIESIDTSIVLISCFLETLCNKGKIVNFQGIGGNHGRVTKDKKEDTVRLGEWFVYKALTYKLHEYTKSKRLNLTYNEDYNKNVHTFVSEGIGYIYHHGDERGLNAKKLFSLYRNCEVFKEWEVKNPDRRLYLAVIQGDKHHFEGMDNQDGTALIVPSLIGGETYSQQKLALSSPAGYMICGNSSEGKYQAFYNEVKRLV